MTYAGRNKTVMHFELKINAKSICRFSATNIGAASPKEPDGAHRYEWMGWRVDPDTDSRIDRYAQGVLEHDRADGVEALAELVLTAYRSAMARATEGALS